jgi:hypothetical protein
MKKTAILREFVSSVLDETSRWTQPSFERNRPTGHDLDRHLSKNQYLRVTSPFRVWYYTGNSRPSNSYYGSANIGSQEIRPLTLHVGDEIHNTFGGVFAVKRNGASYELAFNEVTGDTINFRAHTEQIDQAESTYIPSYRQPNKSGDAYGGAEHDRSPSETIVMTFTDMDDDDDLLDRIEQEIEQCDGTVLSSEMISNDQARIAVRVFDKAAFTKAWKESPAYPYARPKL